MLAHVCGGEQHPRKPYDLPAVLPRGKTCCAACESNRFMKLEDHVANVLALRPDKDMGYEYCFSELEVCNRQLSRNTPPWDSCASGSQMPIRDFFIWSRELMGEVGSLAIEPVSTEQAGQNLLETFSLLQQSQ